MRDSLRTGTVRGAIALGVLGTLGVSLWLAGGTSFFRNARARLLHPYVVVVSLDTLHVDFTRPYNPAVFNTPFLHRLAQEGVTFRNAYTSVPVTLPAHAALFTSVSPLELGTFANGDTVPVGRPTLAERFHEAGYRTAAFVSLGVLRSSFGLARGFELYDDLFLEGGKRWYRSAGEVLDSTDAWLKDWEGEPFFWWIHLSDPHEPYVGDDAPADTVLYLDDRLVGAFRLARNELKTVSIRLSPGAHRLRWQSLHPATEDDLPETELRLSVFQQEALAPFAESTLPPADAEIRLDPDWELRLHNRHVEAVEVPLSFRGRIVAPSPSEVLESYRHQVGVTDRALARLRRRLESLGVADRVLWVVVSDHGEGLYRKGVLGHSRFVFEDQLRVLWLMKGPGIPGGVVVDSGAVSLLDVGPTLLDVLGWPPLPGSEGRSMRGCWSPHRECRPRTEPWWAYGIDHESYRLTALAGYHWPHKWLWHRAHGRSSFLLDQDPWEERDLLDLSGSERPEEIKTLAESFAGVRQKLAERLRRETGSIDDDTHELLKSLGYIE